MSFLCFFFTHIHIEVHCKIIMETHFLANRCDVQDQINILLTSENVIALDGGGDRIFHTSDQRKENYSCQQTTWKYRFQGVLYAARRDLMKIMAYFVFGVFHSIQ